MVTILGTGHVFNLRKRVQAEIHQRMPTVVAIELDPVRFKALQVPKDQRGKGPFFYQLLANFQNRIAEAYGVEPGDEMLAAAEAARELNVPVALIDRDAQQTFKRILKETPFTEKMRLAGSAVGSMFVRSKTVDEQISEMEKDYSKYFAVLGEKFPTLKRVLLDERNVHMAQAIRELSEKHPDMVAVMGDGHVDGVVELLDAWKVPVEALRLRDLRHDDAPAPREDASTARAALSFDVPADPGPWQPRGGE